MNESLPQRMREAAEVLRDVGRRLHLSNDALDNFESTPKILEFDANLWEKEAEQAALVEEMRKDYLQIADSYHSELSPNMLSQRLIEAGWRK